MAPVTTRYLVQGAWYALEQAGLLLRDAVLLYQQKRFPGAVGLALLSREELGKARILLRFIELGRTDLTLKALRDELEKHELKQRAGVVSVTVKVDERLFLAGMLQDPQDEESRAAKKEVDDLADQISKRLPNQRIELRERAFYVDPGEHEWTRPVSLSEDEATRVIWEANYDYAVFSGLVKNSTEFKWLRELLGTWPERPELPAPSLPYPGSSMNLAS